MTYLKALGFFVLLLGVHPAAADAIWARGTSESVLLKRGATRPTSSEAKALVSGRTESWGRPKPGNGGCYYAVDGKLLCIVGRRLNVETWTVRADGRVCYRKCHYYLSLDGRVFAVRDGRLLGAVTLTRGKHL